MTLGEVCFLTNDVVKLANFYKWLLNVDNGSDDAVHQTIIARETMLTVYNDGTPRNNANQNICITFTVEDVCAEHARLAAKGVEILQPPTAQPWGAVNMCFRDPDGNLIYLRGFPK